MHSVLSLVYAFAITNAVHLLSSSTTYAFSEQFRSGYLPAGPFGILGALVYQYYALCPPLWTIGVLDAEMTDRMLVGIPMILVRGSMRTDHFFSNDSLRHLNRHSPASLFCLVYSHRGCILSNGRYKSLCASPDLFSALVDLLLVPIPYLCVHRMHSIAKVDQGVEIT